MARHPRRDGLAIALLRVANPFTGVEVVNEPAYHTRDSERMVGKQICRGSGLAGLQACRHAAQGPTYPPFLLSVIKQVNNFLSCKDCFVSERRQEKKAMRTDGVEAELLKYQEAREVICCERGHRITPSLVRGRKSRHGLQLGLMRASLIAHHEHYMRISKVDNDHELQST